MTVCPTQSDVQVALRSFILGLNLTAAGGGAIECIQGQDNRVPEPKGADYVVMTPIRRERLETNVDADVDASFTGSISGAVMTVTSLALGEITIGSSVYGSAAVGTTVTSLGTGTGGVGTYGVTPPQSLASGPLFAGQHQALQPTEVVVQLDVHGPNSSDNAQVIATMLRDPYAFDQFATYGFDVVPLYADDPRQIPFISGESQYEYRWVVEARLQANQVVSGIGQQFAGAVVVAAVEVQSFPWLLDDAGNALVDDGGVPLGAS